jgi:alpha-L-fucosidase 2
MGAFTQSYLPLGDLWLTFEHGNLGRDYRRELSLGEAVAVAPLPDRRRPLYARGDRRARRRRDCRPHRRRSARVSSRSTRGSPARCDTRSPSKTAVIRLRGVAPAHVEPSYYQADVPVQYGRDGGVAGRRVGRRARRRSRTRAGRHAAGACASSSPSASSPTAARCRPARAACVSKAPNAATVLPRPATAFNGYDKDPGARRPRSWPDRRCARSPPLAARGGRRCATRTSADHRRLFDRVTLELPAAAHRGG